MDNFESSSASTPKSVADCLRDANEQLEIALRQLENGQPLTENENDVDNGSSTVTGSIDMDYYDPDDLAAAFFAQQAQKQQAETKLPIHAWAKTIHSTSSMIRTCDKYDDSIPSAPDRNTQLFEAPPNYANELWNEFKAAYACSETSNP